jgi:geranylgeranyl pyrophosphate synthase
VVNEVIDIVRAGGHIETALTEARRRLEIASDALTGLPDVEARKVMETLGSYLLERVDAAKN